MSASFRLKQEAFLRMVADALLVNAAALTATVVRFLSRILLENPSGLPAARDLFRDFIRSYVHTAPFLTALCLVVFRLSGFYTYGRTYRGRYKVIFVIQAVGMSYLLFGFISYFVSGTLEMPRGVLVLSCVFSAALLTLARIWSLFWRHVVRSEQRTVAAIDEHMIKKVLVIGGAGYIGSALVPKLLQKGYHVRVLDLLMYGADPIRNVMFHPHVEIIEQDFRHVDKVVNSMLDVDAVVHLGAIVGDPACSLDEDVTIEVNLMATRMLAEVAKGSRVSRFIFASTCSVYGANDEILDEHSELNPVSLYARSKIASERVLQEMADEHFAPIILRFGTIYGLSARPRFDLVVNLLTAKAVIDKKVVLHGGDQWRPFVHVDDAALAILKSLELPSAEVRANIFNIGSDGQNMTLAKVAELIQELIPGTQVQNLGADGDRRNYRVSCAKAQRWLHFAPQWTLRDGIIQVKEALETGQVRDYRDARFSNIKFLNEEGVRRFIQPENGWAQELIKRASRQHAVAGRS